jgi:hypothetical protein
MLITCDSSLPEDYRVGVWNALISQWALRGTKQWDQTRLIWKKLEESKGADPID